MRPFNRAAFGAEFKRLRQATGTTCLELGRSLPSMTDRKTPHAILGTYERGEAVMGADTLLASLVMMYGDGWLDAIESLMHAAFDDEVDA